MRLIFTSILLLLSFIGFSQRTYLYGIIKDSTTQKILAGAHIRNVSSQKVTNNGYNGAFKIPVKTSDTLLITYVGYTPITYIVERNWSMRSPISFLLSQETTQLAEVEVNVFPEYWRFKEKIINTQPKDSSLVVFGLKDIPIDAYPVPINQQKIKPRELYPLAIKATFDAGGLSKSSREKGKLAKLMKQKSLHEQAYLKFNREWVSNETKLEGDELTDFIAYCKFTPEYLVETPLFFIYEEMMALLEDFKNERKKSDEKYTPGA